MSFFFCQAEDGIRDVLGSRGLGDVYKRQDYGVSPADDALPAVLGYGDGKMYDSAGNLPIGFREWLQYMSQRVADAAAT